MRLTYSKAVSPQRLLYELMELPVLAPKVLEDGNREAVFVLCCDGQTVYIDAPDDLTPEQLTEIERVVNAHNPS